MQTDIVSRFAWAAELVDVSGQVPFPPVLGIEGAVGDGEASHLTTCHTTSLAHACPASQVTSSLEPMFITVEDVIGAAEIGKMLGVSRQRVQQIVTRADFPTPAKVLAMGKIWLTGDVEKWVREHRTALTEPEPPAKRTPKRRGH